MSYLKAVIKNDKKLEKKYLSKLINTGKKLNVDTKKYQRELKKISQTAQIKSKNKFSIESVYTKDNSIIVNFNKKISEKDIKFFELHYKTLNKDIFDFKGNFKDAKPTKLSIKGVKKISIGQYKANTLRIVISDKKNLKTRYIINKKQIIIRILDVKIINNIKKVKLIKSVPRSTSKKTSKSKYSIDSVYTKNNAIIINFNRRISKEYIKFFELHYKKLSKDVFDIKGRFKDAKPTKLKIKNIDKISISQYKYNTLRISISNRKNAKTIYMINKNQLVIKVLNQNTKTKKVSKAKITTNLPVYRPNNKIVVLDAGHGGKDSGAVGPRKRYEKIVVLKVTKYLYNDLRKKGYKVYITRSTDRFIKVKKRTVLANKKHADIFISVHANAAHRSKVRTARGIETFFLSPARSARAKRVAALENKSDIRKMNYSSKNALLTILNQGKITASNKLAIDVQQNMLFSTRKLYSDVVDGGVREGPFWVLVGAQMPSILVEIGYISHKQESKRLYSSSYQKALSRGIANGVDAYFLKNP